MQITRKLTQSSERCCFGKLLMRLLMDSMCLEFFAALATEDPRPELLLMKPAGRTESLISSKMWKHILTQGIYQMFWLFLILCAASPSSFAAGLRTAHHLLLKML